MYNLPIENKYDKYTFAELYLSMNSQFEKDDIQLASIMAQMAKSTTTLFLDAATSRWYAYRYSGLEKTPFKKFSQSVKNNIYKIFIDNLTLKGYVSLRCLELINENFNLLYKINGPTDYREYSTHRFLLHISDSTFEIFIKDIKDYFSSITSQKYQGLLKAQFPRFIEEYNRTHKQKNIFSYENIDGLCTYIDINDERQVIKYIYNYPEFYNYLAVYSPKTDYKFWVDFFLLYKCTTIAKRHQETINKIIKKMIEKNFYNDGNLFNILVNKKSASHMSIYFSKTIKANLRKDFNLSLICYSNCCAKHKKELKRMLGPEITQSVRFKYMFGSSK